MRTQVEEFLDGWSAQVRIDEENGLTIQLGKCECEIDRCHGLAFTLDRRSNHQSLRSPVGIERDQLMDAPQETLEAVPDVGPIVAARIREFFTETDNRKSVEELRDVGVYWDAPTRSGRRRSRPSR